MATMHSINSTTTAFIAYFKPMAVKIMVKATFEQQVLLSLLEALRTY